MARLQSQTLFLRRALSTLRSPASPSLIHSNRFSSTFSGNGELVEVDLSSSAPAPADGESETLMMKKLDDIVHKLIVRRSTPDWLPFLPGSSFWVPPRQSTSKIVDLFGSLADQLKEEESLAVSSDRGWPCSEFLVDFFQRNECRTDLTEIIETLLENELALGF
ncbi:hypothetical protein UlMin_004675 [Ulmus minor]